MEEKLASDYTGLSFLQLNELCVLDYWLFARDAAIYNLSMSEEGKDYLERCWCGEQTDADRETLRRLF